MLLTSSDPLSTAAASGIFGLGMLITILVVLVPAAVGLWIQYLIIRTAVKNGILRADRERFRASWSTNGWERERL